MLKLNASFSKKVPGEVDFSSKGYSATIEIELSDGLSQQELQDRIHQTFQLVRTSVESELNNDGQQCMPQQQLPALPNNNYLPNTQGQAALLQGQYPQGQTQSQPKRKPAGKASPKQLKFLCDLARNKNIPLDGYLQSFGVSRVEDLESKQCSWIIDQLRSQAA